MKPAQPAFVFLFFILLSQPLLSQQQPDPVLPWQHPIILALEAKKPGILAFAHAKEDDYYLPLAILHRQEQRLYFVNTMGMVTDQLPVAAAVLTALVEKKLDVFDFYANSVSRDQCDEIERVRNMVRQGRFSLEADAYKSMYINYSALTQVSSTLAQVAVLDNYERRVRQTAMLANLVLKEPGDTRFAGKKINWENFEPAKLSTHDIETGAYIEYSVSNCISSLRKAVLGPYTGMITLYDQSDNAFDSFTVHKEKIRQLVDERVDVFALYRNRLEWQLEQVRAAGGALNNDSSYIAPAFYRPAMLRHSKKIALLAEYEARIQDKIRFCVTPDKDLVLLWQAAQCKAGPRKKWTAAKGWEDVPFEALAPGQAMLSTQTRGEKRYFLTDHRGNIVATVTDRKIQVDNNNDGRVDYYVADVVSTTDYSSYGSMLTGRTVGTAERYGYNGKEIDNEVKGTGNQQDYGFRIYDPRIAKFLSVDPLTKEYPELTPYQFASNRPIDGVDMDGLEYSPAGHTKYGARESTSVTQYPRHPAVLQQTNAQVQQALVQRRAQILAPDMYGNGHAGPKWLVEANIAKIRKDYVNAVGDNIAGGPMGAYGY